ncbi:MAG: hypothetical protein M3R63_19415 [Actinomycetota bacterium]|nr:hypothetical protein [Actinomycetota bacterium]
MSIAPDHLRGRDRPSRVPPWGGASLFPGRAGTPWWLAVVLALSFAAAGVFTDLQRIDRLGLVFQACYFLGCVLAVAVVERRGLFGPMVQPPLLLAFVVPGVVLLAGGAPPSGGLTATALAIGTPLINGFPTMAITTGVTVGLGVIRIVTQRPPVVRKPRTRPQPQPKPKPQPKPRRTSRR